MNLGKMNENKRRTTLRAVNTGMRSQFFFTTTYSVLFSSATKSFDRLNEKYFLMRITAGLKLQNYRL